MNREQITDLLERVEGATAGDERDVLYDAIVLFWADVGAPPYRFLKAGAYTDCALALLARVLPGWCKSIVDLSPDELCEAYVWQRGWTHNIKGTGATGALAILSAMLRAMLEMSDDAV